MSNKSSKPNNNLRIKTQVISLTGWEERTFSHSSMSWSRKWPIQTSVARVTRKLRMRTRASQARGSSISNFSTRFLISNSPSSNSRSINIRIWRHKFTGNSSLRFRICKSRSRINEMLKVRIKKLVWLSTRPLSRTKSNEVPEERNLAAAGEWASL